MAYLNESEKRTFIAQTLTIIRNNADKLREKGFVPDGKVAELEQLLHQAELAEAIQTKAKADLHDATHQAKETLNTAYDKTSDAINIVSGALGKKHPLVSQLRKLRKW